jgi:hypothetical protein
MGFVKPEAMTQGKEKGKFGAHQTQNQKMRYSGISIQA